MAGGKILKGRTHSNRQMAAKSGIYFRKSEGQHILKTQHILDKIVAMSGIKSTDIILEIGPGTGNLTQKLLEVGKRVIAIEKDPRMGLELHRRFGGTAFGDRLKVIESDVLKCEIPYFDICVSNIPYKISSPLIFRLLEHQLPFRCAVLMFQEEFALRLCAEPNSKDYSRLTVNVGHLAYVKHLMKVGKKCFCPPPKVNSSVVRIEPKKPFSTSFKEWDGLLRICFLRKEKTLGSIFRLKSVLSLLEHNYKTLQQLSLHQSVEHKEMAFVQGFLHDGNKGSDNDDCIEDMEIDNGCAGCGIKDRVLSVLEEGNFVEKRAIQLTHENFIKLLSLFNKAGIHFA